MPIYEFICGDCHSEFEELVNGSLKPTCPKCQGKKLTKKLSLIAAPATGNKKDAGFCAPTPRGGCGVPHCGPGGCGY